VGFRLYVLREGRIEDRRGLRSGVPAADEAGDIAGKVQIAVKVEIVLPFGFELIAVGEGIIRPQDELAFETVPDGRVRGQQAVEEDGCVKGLNIRNRYGIQRMLLADAFFPDVTVGKAVRVDGIVIGPVPQLVGARKTGPRDKGAGAGHIEGS